MHLAAHLQEVLRKQCALGATSSLETTNVRASSLGSMQSSLEVMNPCPMLWWNVWAYQGVANVWPPDVEQQACQVNSVLAYLHPEVEESAPSTLSHFVDEANCKQRVDYDSHPHHVGCMIPRDSFEKALSIQPQVDERVRSSSQGAPKWPDSTEAQQLAFCAAYEENHRDTASSMNDKTRGKHIREEAWRDYNENATDVAISQQASA